MFSGWFDKGYPIKEIWIHPVKSLKGLQVDQVQIDEFGFKYDRKYMVAQPKKKDPQQYEFVTQREIPLFTLIETSIDYDNLTLTLYYPKTDSRLTIGLGIEEEVLEKNCAVIPTMIWGQSPKSYDLCGLYPEIRTFWKQVFASEPDRNLTIVAPCTRRIVDPRRGGPGEETLDRVPQSGYQDYFPGNLITTASLNDLAEKVDEKTNGSVKIVQRNFRPNLLIETSNPYEEDDWKIITINNSHTWYVACRNIRCQVTTVNLEKGQFEQSHEPYKVMQSFRRVDPGAKYLPCFGMNMVQKETGYVIRVGDIVRVKHRGQHHYVSIKSTS